jgi:tetratricopeptide (TPR) repeat protein
MAWRILWVLITATLCAFSQTTDCNSVESCTQAVKARWTDSMAHYRLGEIYFEARNYLESGNEFREALIGDRKPKWIEVWAHVNLGKIFDTTGQRERALNEYRLAMRTGDNTRAALEEAKKYTEEPYKRSR